MSEASPSSRILGLGSYVPGVGVEGQEGLASSEEVSSDLAVKAAQAALAEAGVSVGELQMLVVATTSGDSPMPATAATVQRKLGAQLIPSFDVNASGAGFLYALSVADQFLAASHLRTILVVGVELPSRHQTRDADGLPRADFGDGAGAFLLGKAEGGSAGVLGTSLHADSAESSLMTVPAGGSAEPLSAEGLAGGRSRLQVDLDRLEEVSSERLGACARRVLQEAGVGAEELALVLAQPGGTRVREALQRSLGVELPEGCWRAADSSRGNLGAAGLPLALAEARAEGRVKAGDRVLLCGAGAGLTWGAALLRL